MDDREYWLSLPDELRTSFVEEYVDSVKARLPFQPLPLYSVDQLNQVGYLTYDFEAIGAPYEMYSDDILRTLDDMLCHPEKYERGLILDPEGIPGTALYLLPWSFEHNPIRDEALRRGLIK